MERGHPGTMEQLDLANTKPDYGCRDVGEGVAVIRVREKGDCPQSRLFKNGDNTLLRHINQPTRPPGSRSYPSGAHAERTRSAKRGYARSFARRRRFPGPGANAPIPGPCPTPSYGYVFHVLPALHATTKSGRN